MIKRVRFSAVTVSLGFVAVSLVALALFATPLWYAWTATIEQGEAEVMHTDARRLTDLYNRRGPDVLANAIEAQVGEGFGERIRIFMMVADPDYRKIAGNLPTWPRDIPASDKVQYTSIRIEGRITRGAVLHIALRGGYHLLLGRDVQRFRRLEQLFVYGLLGAAGVVLILGIVGGWLVRYTLLSKVSDINQAAAAIMHGDLSHRLPEHEGEHELNRLVETENRMLDQIEHLVMGIRNVSNSIAHDLRTPLMELRARLEELAVTRPEPQQVFVEIDGAICDVDRVISVFNALLRMAEIDAGLRRAGFVVIDASQIATEAVEFYLPVAELNGVALSVVTAGPIQLLGDPVLLAQAIGNLIDNAIKYVRESGRIAVTVEHAANDTIEISVSDNGPGIPDSEKPKVFERFYRSDTSRGTPGAGLGLTLVAAVAKLHGGTVAVADNHPGLRATLTLPALQQHAYAR